MPYPHQIEEQVRWERDAIAHGLKELRKNTRNLEEKSYASASIYGVASIETLLPLVKAEIEETNSRIHNGQNGAAFKEIALYLRELEPLAAAAIACKVVFDRVFSAQPDTDIMVSVLEAVGKAVENECQMRHYEKVAPGLLNWIQSNCFHRSKGTEYKLTTIKTKMNRLDIPKWKCWHPKTRTKLGGWLVDCIMKCSGWFEKKKERKGKRTILRLSPTDAFLEIKDQIIEQAELFSPENWAMLIEPNDWSETKPGGYLLNEVMRGHKMVRGFNHSPVQGETPYLFLNKLQKVKYKLNPFIMEVAETLYEKGHTIGKFRPPSQEPEPPKPVDMDDMEARTEWRAKETDWHNRIRDNAKKSVRTVKTMIAARRMGERDFYLPWSFDYRGRAYPIPTYLTPQDTDFGKSLLLFGESSFVTPEAEDWLRFQVATTYGLDKKPMKERLEWVVHNTDLISRIATDPLGYISDWEVADEPWLFLAACEEYYHTCINCDRNTTSLPIAVDATCSGLQILSGLCRDATTASLVNVLPGVKPQDAYRAVAERAKPNIPEQWREHVDRGVAKRLVMTIPYNAKFKSNWGYVKDALNDKIEDGGKELDVPKEDITKITHALREAVFELFPGPTSVMTWIEDEVKLALKRGERELTWVTPSGFVAFQKYMKRKTERIDLKLLGRCQITVATGETDEVDYNHHKNATSPNLIHSLDASLLHLSTLRFDAPISLIHDSVLCRATDMSTLSRIVRETYMHLFAENSYLESWAEQIGAETKPPIIGDLAPESVIESTYFFC